LGQNLAPALTSFGPHPNCANLRRGYFMPCSATILCVDDEELSLKVRKLVLEGAGYTVLTATTPDAALSLFQSNSVDLVMTDHLLPGISGTQLAQRMKKLKPAVPNRASQRTARAAPRLRLCGLLHRKGRGASGRSAKNRANPRLQAEVEKRFRTVVAVRQVPNSSCFEVFRQRTGCEANSG